VFFFLSRARRAARRPLRPPAGQRARLHLLLPRGERRDDVGPALGLIFNQQPAKL
jgi:hypothetical protein